MTMRKTNNFIQVLSASLMTLAVSALSTVAAAESANVDMAAAQALFDQGRQLMSQGNFAEACPKLEESARIVGHSGTLLNLADCFEKQGRVSSAWTTFLSAAVAARRTNNVDRETEARNRANALQPLLPKIVINVGAADKDSGITITRDGTTVGQAQFGVPIPMDPGAHNVTASMPGRKTWETSIEIKTKGEVVRVDVPMLAVQSAVTPGAAPTRADAKPLARQSPSPAKNGRQRTWALVIGGAGVAGVAVGGVAGLVSMSKHNKADNHCSGSHCSDAQGVSLRSDARTWGNVSTIAFLVGAAGLATGATLWISSPKTESPTTAWVTLGPAGVGMNGTW